MYLLGIALIGKIVYLLTTPTSSTSLFQPSTFHILSQLSTTSTFIFSSHIISLSLSKQKEAKKTKIKTMMNVDVSNIPLRMSETELIHEAYDMRLHPNTLMKRQEDDDEEQQQTRTSIIIQNRHRHPRDHHHDDLVTSAVVHHQQQQKTQPTVPASPSSSPPSSFHHHDDNDEDGTFSPRIRIRRRSSSSIRQLSILQDDEEENDDMHSSSSNNTSQPPRSTSGKKKTQKKQSRSKDQIESQLPPHRATVVTFDRNVQCHIVESLQDLPLWYTRLEMKEIYKNIETTITMLRSGQIKNPECIGYCYRGLEHKLHSTTTTTTTTRMTTTTTTRGRRRRSRNEQVHRAVNVVLRTQSLLLCGCGYKKTKTKTQFVTKTTTTGGEVGGDNDPSSQISRWYSNETRSDKLEAYKRGLADAKEVLDDTTSSSSSSSLPQQQGGGGGVVISRNLTIHQSSKDEAPKIPPRRSSTSYSSST